MLGFRGHFSTKSRKYSVTLGRLRQARARFARLLADDEETTLVVDGSWSYVGTGWPTNGSLVAVFPSP
jgi:hypothetical protein